MDMLIGYLRNKTSIRFRVLLFGGLMVGALYVATVLAVNTYTSFAKETRLSSFDIITKELLTKACEYALSRGQPSELEGISQALLMWEEVHSLKVFDAQGEVFFSKSKEAVAKEESLIEFKADIVRQVIAPNYDELSDAASMVTTRRVALGQIQIQIIEDVLVNSVWSGIWSGFALMIIFILAVLPLSYILAASLVRPLKEIVSDLNKFERGDYSDLGSGAKYSDEYGLISLSLQKAGESISRKTKKINESNEALLLRSEELVEQSNKAIAAREVADEAVTKKDIFVANITHELKTPLTGIVAAIDLIEQSVAVLIEKQESGLPVGIGYKQQQGLSRDYMQLLNCVDIAKYSGNQLESLISEILCSIQEMYLDVDLEMSPVELPGSLRGLFDIHKGNAEAKGLDFSLKMEKSDDIWVLADWHRVAQVINSLLFNAVQFTEKGGIEIDARVYGDKNNVSLYLEINDTGVGIPESEKERIFSLFHIGESPENKLLSGIGAGLSIAQHISERIGGALSLQRSVPGKGSCFVFVCDFERCETDNVLAFKKLVNMKCSKSYTLKLLYVEDSRINQMIFSEYCSRAGVEVVISNNGKEGLEKFTHGNFDGLIVDCYMPVMNGYEMVRAIRELEASESRQPSLVIALTADPSLKNRTLCMEAGFDEFVTKPYTRAIFYKVLEMVADCREKIRALV